MSGFEKFTHRQTRVYKEPTASLSRSRSIGLNAMTMHKYVGDKDFAILFYDKENKLIGIKFTETGTPESYKIRKYREGRLGAITAISFLKYYSIPHDKTRTYKADWNEQEKMLVIDLKNPIQEKEIQQPSLPEVEDDEVPF